MGKNNDNILIQADTSSIEETKNALNNGAEGIGILRTEHIAHCSEDEQFKFYRQILESAAGRPVTIRTYVGSDEKPNGLWGIRYSMSYPEFFQRQLRAILKASTYGNVKIAFPGVTVIEEYQWAKKQVDIAKEDYQEQENSNSHIPLGIMVEIPSVVICLEMFIHEVNFYIIDTDILFRNLAAADDLKNIPGNLTDPLHPILLRTISTFIRGKSDKKPLVSICGSLVKTDYALPVLKGIGVSSIAVSDKNISQMQLLAEKLDKENSMKIASKTLVLSNNDRIRNYIKTAMKKIIQ